MLRVGLNPYGVAYTVGLHAAGTPRANPAPIGLAGFIALARELGSPSIELDWRWLLPLARAELAQLRDELHDFSPILFSYWLQHEPGETLDAALACASALGARTIRLHLTPVLEGARAARGAQWTAMLAHARRTLRAASPPIRDAGLGLVIENHQDLGSEELLALCGELGDHAGIVLDTGNPYAVGEDPVAFARRARERIRHLHLKDYRAQFTREGFRLVRCALGEGCVPFDAIVEALADGAGALTASIEPGALESRHIRLFLPEWWTGYPPRDARELGELLGRLQRGLLPAGADARTPWERGDDPAAIAAYELDELRRSVAWVRTRPWGAGR